MALAFIKKTNFVKGDRTTPLALQASDLNDLKNLSIICTIKYAFMLLFYREMPLKVKNMHKNVLRFFWFFTHLHAMNFLRHFLHIHSVRKTISIAFVRYLTKIR